eukprot:evm.model.scf_1604.3 EVM.evm.TU.scf_1604.3   scf_1604:25776-34305(+)
MHEWCANHEEHQLTLQQLADLLKKTEEETKNIVGDIQTPLLLVTEEAAIAYLRCKHEMRRKGTRAAGDGEVADDDIEELVNLDDAAAHIFKLASPPADTDTSSDSGDHSRDSGNNSSDDDDAHDAKHSPSQQRSKTKEAKQKHFKKEPGAQTHKNLRRTTRQKTDFLTPQDCTAYVTALAELEGHQKKWLGIQHIIPSIRNGRALTSYMHTVKRKGVEIKLRDSMDKGLKSLKTYPTIEQWNNMLDACWHQGNDKLVAHTWLMHGNQLADMKASAIRGDNEYRQLYSDKQVFDLKNYVANPDEYPMMMFTTMSRMGKENKNANLDYFCKTMGKDPLKCAVVMEAVLMVFRHDIMGIARPQFHLVLKGKKLQRPWHQDCWFPKLGMKGKRKRHLHVHGGKGKGQGPKVDHTLKRPYSMAAMAKQFAKLYMNSGINTWHLVHMPRGYATFLMQCRGAELSMVEQLGKWRSMRDNMHESYAQLDSRTSLALQADFASKEAYRPDWAVLHPPPELLELVLNGFREDLQAAKKRLEASKCAKEHSDALELSDTQAVYTCEYMVALSQVFIQAAPFIQAKHPNHLLIKEHPLFKHSTYTVFWKPLQYYNYVQLHELAKIPGQRPLAPIEISIEELTTKCGATKATKNVFNRCLGIAKHNVWKELGGLLPTLEGGCFYVNHLAQRGTMLLNTTVNPPPQVSAPPPPSNPWATIGSKGLPSMTNLPQTSTSAELGKDEGGLSQHRQMKDGQPLAVAMLDPMVINPIPLPASATQLSPEMSSYLMQQQAQMATLSAQNDLLRKMMLSMMQNQSSINSSLCQHMANSCTRQPLLPVGRESASVQPRKRKRKCTNAPVATAVLCSSGLSKNLRTDDDLNGSDDRGDTLEATPTAPATNDGAQMQAAIDIFAVEDKVDVVAMTVPCFSALDAQANNLTALWNQWTEPQQEGQQSLRDLCLSGNKKKRAIPKYLQESVKRTRQVLEF